MYRRPIRTLLWLYREQYFDLNVQHFHEKLKEKHGIDTELHVGEDQPRPLSGASQTPMRARGRLILPRPGELGGHT